MVCHTYCISRRRHNLKPQMTFQNSNGYNLHWTTSCTNKQLHAWCLENGIKLPKSSTKDTFCCALQKRMVECGIDTENHPDFVRARG